MKSDDFIDRIVKAEAASEAEKQLLVHAENAIKEIDAAYDYSHAEVFRERIQKILDRYYQAKKEINASVPRENNLF